MTYFLLAVNPITLFVLFLLTFKVHKAFGVIGWPVDALFNLTWGTMLFWQFPTTVTFTQRLQKNKKLDDGRGEFANWICVNILNRFVAGHCK